MATTDEQPGETNTQHGAAPQSRQQHESDLRKSNIKAVFGSGPGRIALIVVVITVLVLFAVGAMNLFRRKAPPPEQMPNANGAVLSAPSARGDATVTSEQEAQLRREASNRDSAAAAESGKTFLAPPILRGSSDSGATSQDSKEQVAAMVGPIRNQQLLSAAQAEREKQAATASNPVASQPVQGGAQAAVQPLPPIPPSMPANWEKVRADEITPQILKALGRNRDGSPPGGFTSSSYALPDRSVKTQQVADGAAAAKVGTAAGTAQASTAKVLLAQAGDGYYCETDTKINTDASRNDVLVTCYQGKLMNARLIGKYDATNEAAVNGSVSILLTALSLPGKPMIAVQAIAFDEQTGDSGLADEVDDHTMRKYGGLFFASLAKGFGKAAQIITGSTTTVSNGGISTTTSVTDAVSPARQAKIAVGEVGTTFGDALQRSSEKIKRTVKVGDKKGVRVVFLTDVYDEKK